MTLYKQWDRRNDFILVISPREFIRASDWDGGWLTTESELP